MNGIYSNAKNGRQHLPNYIGIKIPDTIWYFKMSKINLNKKNSKIYKYKLLDNIRIFPSDPTGSLDDSVFIFLNKLEGLFDGRNFSFS